MSANIARRALLRAMGATAMAAGGFDRSLAEAQLPAPWSSGTETPKLKAPPNACDCHMHIYDSRFPVAPNAKLRPPDATVRLSAVAEAYRRDAQRRRHAVDLRHGQFLHCRRDR
jgi:hypothetical protein